ncbi:hypothetical protein GCM10010421_28190 [Streptomyces glaucus]|uniref:Transposase n=1 Tax=Streptomyces glaucus TaxID=284029 RepID=A0ABN3JPQ9_9ACTN
MSCFRRAQLALAHLRKKERLAQPSAGFGVSEATAWRYVDETVDVLAAWTSGLREALTGRGKDDFVILDGTPIPTDRVAADEPYSSQKHQKHGMNAQVVAAPDGTPLWFSWALPGRTHHLTAARAHGVIENCLTRQILVLADRAHQGAGATVRTPTTTANCPSTTSGTTRTTPDCAPPANAPSHSREPGVDFVEPDARPTATDTSSPPSTRS